MTGPLQWAAFLAACGLGAPARYLIDQWVQNRSGGSFPLGTMTVNVAGCLLLGLITGLSLDNGPALTILGTGFCGAFTTFSTLTMETVRLLEDRNTVGALVNVAGSLTAGMAAAAVGLFVGGL